MEEEPNSFLADNDDSFQSNDYKVIVVNLTRDDDNTVTCAINKKIEGKSHVTQRETDGLPGNHVGSSRVQDNELSYLVSEVGEVGDDYEMTELKVEAVEVHKVARYLTCTWFARGLSQPMKKTSCCCDDYTAWLLDLLVCKHGLLSFFSLVPRLDSTIW